MILEGKKVRLRPFEENDLDHIMEWINDHEATRNLLVGRYPMTRQMEKDWLYHDIISMSLLRSEWQASRGKRVSSCRAVGCANWAELELLLCRFSQYGYKLKFPKAPDVVGGVQSKVTVSTRTSLGKP